MLPEDANACLSFLDREMLHDVEMLKKQSGSIIFELAKDSDNATTKFPCTCTILGDKSQNDC